MRHHWHLPDWRKLKSLTTSRMSTLASVHLLDISHAFYINKLNNISTKKQVRIFPSKRFLIHLEKAISLKQKWVQKPVCSGLKFLPGGTLNNCTLFQTYPERWTNRAATLRESHSEGFWDFFFKKLNKQAGGQA